MDKTKIIVVEDNIVYCEYVCNMLSREGYHTMKAYHLSTAKKHLQQATDNDIVVADLRLPDGNGIDLLRWMRKEGKMQPFIIMTDYAEVHTAVESMKLGSLLAVCSASAQISRQEGTDGQAAICRLPLFERAVRCTKYFEGWHSEKHHPYVGYGHRLLPGERYSARTMTKRQADALLRKDMRKFCAMFRQFGKDSLLLATLAYNVGPYRLLGSKTIPKSTLIKKLEAGDRNIYREYIAFCNYKGKRHAMLLKRRKAEFELLYIK